MKARHRRELQRQAGLALLGIVSCLLLTGCGDSRVTIKGTVNVNGKPADEGTITFAAADGQGPSIGGKIENGKYFLEGQSGVQPGKKRVIIAPFVKTGRRIPAGNPLPPGTMIDEIKVYPDLGELNKDLLQNVEVVAGKVNEINFDLKAPK